MKIKNRDLSIDVIKLIAILFIVLTHIFQRTIPNYVDNKTFTSVFLIYLSLPILFFLSGVSYSKKDPLTYHNFFYEILKRTFMYFWPFFTFILFRILIYKQYENINEAFIYLMNSPVSGLWFLWVLYWLILTLDIALFISSFFPKYKKFIVISFFIFSLFLIITLRNAWVIPGDSSFGYNYFLLYAPTFLFGYIIGERFLISINKINGYIFLFIGFIGIIISSFLSNNILSKNFLINAPGYYLAFLFSITFYYGLNQILLRHLKKVTPLAFFGRFTLEIYYIHLLIIKAWTFISMPNFTLIIIVSFALLLLCLLGTFLILLIMYHIPFSHFLVFGKSFSKYKFEENIFIKIKDILTF